MAKRKRKPHRARMRQNPKEMAPTSGPEQKARDPDLGGHFKTGQWWSPQKRPMGMARDSVVLPL